MRILGIDPGYDRCGVALIEKSKTGERLIFSTCIIPPYRGDMEKRLEALWHTLTDIFDEQKPDCLAFEEVFSEKNVTTVIGIGQVIGMLRAQAYKKCIPIYAYTPLQVKSAVTGNGRANKADMARMVPLLVKLDGKKKMLDDELDAIAVALTCSAYLKSTIEV